MQKQGNTRRVSTARCCLEPSARVQSIDDLRGWLDWQNLTLSNASVEFIDSDASTAGCRVYRAIPPLSE